MDSELTTETQPAPHAPRRKAIGSARSGFLVALVGLFLVLSFFLYNFQFVIVSGRSMSPTLLPDQRILVCKALWAFGPSRGDIVVIDTENGFIVKRVAYLPGEQVPPESRPFSWPREPNFEVPIGSVYVLGDNLRASEDSRAFGPVPLDHVVGKAVWLK